MATRENTGKIMLDALQVRRAVLMEIVKGLEARLADLQSIVDDRDQLLVDIQSIENEMVSVAIEKKLSTEVLPR